MEPTQAKLYGRMMKAISRSHSFGNTVRMVKLPLIFMDELLYAGAIAQFHLLSEALEGGLLCHASHPLVAKLDALELEVTPGYASDLKELYGKDWRAKAAGACTPQTAEYIKILEGADAVTLVAAAFILYGALVVGGGKVTQRKVKRVLPNCKHVLFDVAEDMGAARQRFKDTFNEIGEAFPEHAANLEEQATRFMQLNNTVILSIPCWGRSATAMALTTAITVAATAGAVAALLRLRRGA